MSTVVVPMISLYVSTHARENHTAIGSLSNNVLDPLEIHKATWPAFNGVWVLFPSTHQLKNTKIKHKTPLQKHTKKQSVVNVKLDTISVHDLYCCHCAFLCLSHERKKEGKYQDSIQSSTTPGPWHQWKSDNATIRHHKRETRSQPFPSR